MAVVATLSKGYDLDYIWTQVDRGPAKDAASYYIQASETGGEPPGRWWGPGAKALGFEQFDDTSRLRVNALTGDRVLLGYANHLRVPAQKDVGIAGIEFGTESVFQLTR